MQKYYYTLQYRSSRPGARICSQIIEANDASEAIEIFSSIIGDGYSILAINLLPADVFSTSYLYDDYTHAAQARTENAIESYNQED